MANKELHIEQEKFVLEEVAEYDGRKLYRVKNDWRITGAPMKDVREKFPEYKFDLFEPFLFNYLFEENGNLVFYGPDGEEIEPIVED